MTSMCRGAEIGRSHSRRAMPQGLNGSWLLLPCRDRLFHAGNLNPTESLGITRNTAIERFRDALAVFRCAQLALVGWITDERDLRQDRGHVGADQHDKGRFLYSTILY